MRNANARASLDGKYRTAASISAVSASPWALGQKKKQKTEHRGLPRFACSWPLSATSLSLFVGPTRKIPPCSTKTVEVQRSGAKSRHKARCAFPSQHVRFDGGKPRALSSIPKKNVPRCPAAVQEGRDVLVNQGGLDTAKVVLTRRARPEKLGSAHVTAPPGRLWSFARPKQALKPASSARGPWNQPTSCIF